MEALTTFSQANLDFFLQNPPGYEHEIRWVWECAVWTSIIIFSLFLSCLKGRFRSVFSETDVVVKEQIATICCLYVVNVVQLGKLEHVGFFQEGPSSRKNLIFISDNITPLSSMKLAPLIPRLMI